MKTFSGVGVSAGRVIGRVKLMLPAITEPPAGQPLPAGISAEQAIAALKTAAAEVQAELRQRADRADGDAKEILQATAVLATDPMLIKSAAKLIGSGLSAERALWQAAEEAAGMLSKLGGYMAERVRDVYDVRSRLVARLRGVPAPGIPDGPEPFILIAEDLSPADTAALDTSLVLGLATTGGGPQSHTAIIARALGLPAIVALGAVTDLAEGTEVFLDGASGALSVQPDADQRAAAQAWSAAAPAEFNGRGALSDGRPIALLANIGNAQEAAQAEQLGAAGIGLFRTEFLFLNRDAEPTVAEQVAAYRAVFETFARSGGEPKVVVRTLDSGADKPLPFLSGGAEPNPALGVRGFRTAARHPEVLRRQLTAISTAAQDFQTQDFQAPGARVQVWVMAPMVSTAAEAADFVAACRQAGLPSSGVMIEVPSAAINAAKLFDQVDFASLGTNDLTQYVMAADRQLGPLAALNDPWQPAVLNLIAVSAEAATSSAKPLGVCGEAAADPAFAVVLAGLGISSLSMTARAIPAVAAVLNTVSGSQAAELAAAALQADGPAAAKAAVRAGLPVLSRLGL